MTKIAWGALIAVTVFNAVSAVAGGVALLVTDGLGMPASWLANGPFDSFFWPSLILLVVIGGSQTLAAVLLLRRRESSLLWTSVAGFAMIIWILVEVAMIHEFSWLQALYFATGVAQLALVFALLGIVSWLPRMELRRGTQ